MLALWQQAAAVTLVVKLSTDDPANDDHRTVLRDLADARSHLNAGGWTGSIRASGGRGRDPARHACRVPNPKKPLRDHQNECQAAILDAGHNLIQALFGHGPAAHPDLGLHTITWTHEHAMLILATATVVAQRFFSAS